MEEIDLLDIVKLFWAKKKFLAKILASVCLLGIIIAFTAPVEYKSSCKLLTENLDDSGSSLSGLSGLAGLAGINLSSSTSSSLLPQLYPELVYSLPFLLEVLNDSIYFENLGAKTTTFNYFKEIEKPSIAKNVFKYTFGIVGVIKSIIFDEEEVTDIMKVDGFYKIPKGDWELIQNFKDRVIVEYDNSMRLVIIEVEMPDPYAAAYLTDNIAKKVTEAVTKYNTDKEKMNLSFAEESYAEAKEHYLRIQSRLANQIDGNINVNSSRNKFQIKSLEQEYNMSYEIMKGLATQIEQLKFQLRENTPIFTIVDPVRIPEDQSKPKRVVIIVISIVIGFIIATLTILIQSIGFRSISDANG